MNADRSFGHDRIVFYIKFIVRSIFSCFAWKMVITKCREESEKGEPTKKTRAAKTKASKKSKKKKSADSDEDEDEDPDAHHTALAPGKDDDDDDDSPDLDGMEELLKLNEVDVKKKPASRKGTDTKRRPAAAGSKSKPPKKKKEDWRLLLCLLFIDFLDLSVGGHPWWAWQEAGAIPFQFDIEGCDGVLKCLGRNRFTCFMPLDE